MYKSIALSILCMSLVSFGMESGFTDQSLHDPDLQTAILSLFADDDSSVSSQSNAVNTQLHFSDLQSTQISVFACDELLADEADEEDQPTISYNASTLQKIQKRCAENRLQCPIEDCFTCFTRPSHMADHAAALHNICLLCEPPYCPEAEGMKQHFQEKHPSKNYATRDKRKTCEECNKEMLASSIQKHLKMHARKKMRSDALAAFDHIVLDHVDLLEQLKEVQSLSGTVQEESSQSSSSSVSRVGVAQQQPSFSEVHDESLDDADKEEASPIRQSQIVQRAQQTIAYNASMLQEIQKRYTENRTQCPLLSCLKSLRVASYTVDHVVANHNICLLCEPPYSANTEDMKQHFQEKHPTAPYAVRNRRIACVQCGKEMLEKSMKEHLKVHAGNNIGPDTAAAVVTSDKS